MSTLLNEVAWAMQARDEGEPVCRDVAPEPYFLDLAKAALTGVMNVPTARTSLGESLYQEILVLTGNCGTEAA